jgi:hypothetical protein
LYIRSLALGWGHSLSRLSLQSTQHDKELYRVFSQVIVQLHTKQSHKKIGQDDSQLLNLAMQA